MENNTEKKSKNLMSMDIKDLTSIFSKKLKKMNDATKIEGKKKVVAFDIGSCNIKVVEGMYYKDKLLIKKCVEVPTPENSVNDGCIINESAIISTLKFVLKENNITSKYGICTTNSSLIINRDMVIPKLEFDEIETYVKYEMQQYLSINLDNYILQVSILNENVLGEKDKMKVRVISFPKKISNVYFRVLDELNLKPYVLDVSYNSLNKILKLSDILKVNSKENRDITAVIDMGHTLTNVDIYDGDILDFTRLIKTGGFQIDQELIEKCNATLSTVLKIKEDKGDLTLDNPEGEGAVIKAVVDEWIDKIDKILNFYRNKNNNKEIRRIILLGQGSRIKGLDSYLNQRLNVECIRLDNIVNNEKITIKDSNVGVDTYINAIGSIIRL